MANNKNFWDFASEEPEIVLVCVAAVVFGAMYIFG